MPIKKKRFFPVDVPLINEEVHLLGYDWQDLDNRTLTIDLTRILRGKNIDLCAKVIVDGDRAQAYPTSLKLLKYFLVKAVRKGTDYVEDSFEVECRDATVRIKPFLVTRKRVSRAVLNALRNKAKNELTAWAKEKLVEKLFEDVLKNKVQKQISLILKKIYPLTLCEVRILEVISWKTKPTFVHTKEKITEKPIEIESVELNEEIIEEKN